MSRPSLAFLEFLECVRVLARRCECGTCRSSPKSPPGTLKSPPVESSSAFEGLGKLDCRIRRQARKAFQQPAYWPRGHTKTSRSARLETSTGLEPRSSSMSPWARSWKFCQDCPILGNPGWTRELCSVVRVLGSRRRSPWSGVPSPIPSYP